MLNPEPGQIMVQISNYGNRYSLVKVAKVTDTFIILTNNGRFRRRDGTSTSGRSNDAITITSDPAHFKIARKQRVKQLLSTSWPLSKEGVGNMRKAADYAEQYLRNDGNWDEKPTE
jgi:hypothetical protein